MRQNSERVVGARVRGKHGERVQRWDGEKVGGQMVDRLGGKKDMRVKGFGTQGWGVKGHEGERVQG